MKRNYVKPEIMFEDFSLSTNIASGCDVDRQFARGVCAYKLSGDFGDTIIFTSEVTGCAEAGKDSVVDDGYNGICYDVPAENNNLFNS